MRSLNIDVEKSKAYCNCNCGGVRSPTLRKTIRVANRFGIVAPSPEPDLATAPFFRTINLNA